MATLIPQATGTAIGNMTENGNLAAAFDGVTSQAATACAFKTGGGGTVGKDYGAGVTYDVVQWKFWGSNDFGVHNEAANSPGTVALQSSSDNSSWTTRDSYTTTNNNATTAAGINRTFTSAGAFRYWRLLAPATGDSRVAELELYQADKTVAVGVGSYALSGQTTTLTPARTLAADVGSYVLSGQAVALLFARIMPIGVGTYVFNGQDVILNKGQTLVANVGSFALTGQDVLFQRVVGTGIGTFTLGGQDVGITAQRMVSIGTGVYVLSGQAVNLQSIIGVLASTGVYLLNPQAVGLPVVMNAEAAEFLLTGKDVELRIGSAPYWQPDASFGDTWIPESAL